MLRKLLIEKLGGYATVNDAIDAISRKELKERNVILTMAVKKMFNTIGADDILKQNPAGEWIFAGKTLSKTQIESLMLEADMLQKMFLWKILQQDVLYQVNRKMYLQASNEMHVVTSKFWLYTFDVFRTRLKSLAAGTAIFNPKK